MIKNDTISIKNFGPIKHIELDIKDIMIFIGPQASGKSTIAKLIHFFKHVISESLYLKNPDNAMPLFKTFFGERYILNSPSAEIVYHCKTYHITLEKGKIYHEPLLETPDYKTILIPAGRAVYSLISDSLFSLTSESVNIDPMILNFGRHIELSRHKIGNIARKKKDLEHLFQEILKGEFKYVNGENRIYFFQDNTQVCSKDKYITLDRASSGQQEVLPLLLILKNIFYSKQIHFVTIEEPEAHLYPYSQYKLIELISRLHNSIPKKHKLIITTHSPYILSAFNNVMFAYQTAQLTNAKSEVHDVIPKQSWINPKKVGAYFVENGTIKTIINPSTTLIADNEIDDVSEDIAGDFDALLDIYGTCKHG